ncbi:MAG: hypothetical protein RSD63_09735, partial [Eubacterium sp.]
RGGENGCISACGVCGDVLHGGADLRGGVRCDCRSSCYCCNFYNRGILEVKMHHYITKFVENGLQDD